MSNVQSFLQPLHASSSAASNHVMHFAKSLLYIETALRSHHIVMSTMLLGFYCRLCWRRSRGSGNRSAPCRAARRTSCTPSSRPALRTWPWTSPFCRCHSLRLLLTLLHLEGFQSPVNFIGLSWSAFRCDDGAMGNGFNHVVDECWLV